MSYESISVATSDDFACVDFHLCIATYEKPLPSVGETWRIAFVMGPIKITAIKRCFDNSLAVHFVGTGTNQGKMYEWDVPTFLTLADRLDEGANHDA